ncbi:hypothetical protein U0070_027410 [Myodes glareolus]|uniref:GAT domain-containing protein n=1 Tax=Myodes glareolus TaxID=447135 RepID=A0AAW0J8N6_MYOGA
MQERIMDLLVVVENEDVTVELIQVNEDLNNAILGYERFTRNQQRLLEQNRNLNEATNTSNEPSAPSCDLLDLSPILPTPMSNGEALNTVNAQLSALKLFMKKLMFTTTKELKITVTAKVKKKKNPPAYAT